MDVLTANTTALSTDAGKSRLEADAVILQTLTFFAVAGFLRGMMELLLVHSDELILQRIREFVVLTPIEANRLGF